MIRARPKDLQICASFQRHAEFVVHWRSISIVLAGRYGNCACLCVGVARARRQWARERGGGEKGAPSHDVLARSSPVIGLIFSSSRQIGANTSGPKKMIAASLARQIVAPAR